MMKVEFKDAVDDGRGHWSVQCIFTYDDGTVREGTHVFPYDTMEWRAAEYDIDPKDRDTLLDIVLTEAHLTDEDWEEGEHLADAGSIEKARQDHIARCAKAKLRNRMSTRAAGKKAHVCDLVRNQSPMNPEAIKLKKDISHKNREKHQREKRRKQKRMGLLAEVDGTEAERIRALRVQRDRLFEGDGTAEIVRQTAERAKQRVRGEQFWDQQRKSRRRAQ